MVTGWMVGGEDISLFMIDGKCGGLNGEILISSLRPVIIALG